MSALCTAVPLDDMNMKTGPSRFRLVHVLCPMFLRVFLGPLCSTKSMIYKLRSETPTVSKPTQTLLFLFAPCPCMGDFQVKLERREIGVIMSQRKEYPQAMRSLHADISLFSRTRGWSASSTTSAWRAVFVQREQHGKTPGQTEGNRTKVWKWFAKYFEEALCDAGMSRQTTGG